MLSSRISLIFIILYIILQLSFGSNLLANDSETDKTARVVVTGHGVDIDKAKENAIRNAVEKVIGVYVSSETVVQNNQLIKDEILKYSGGYIKEMKITSQSKNENALYEVQIDALVVIAKLKKKLVENHIATNKVEGESLFGEAVSKIQMQQSASDLLVSTVKKYPQHAYVIKIGRLELMSTDPDKNMADVVLPITITWDESFLSEFRDNIARIAVEHFDRTDMLTLERKILQIPSICFAKKTTIKNGFVDACYVIDSVIYNKAASGPKSLLALPSSPQMSLTIFFKDAKGAVVDEMQYVFSNNSASKNADDDSAQKQGIPAKSLETNSGAYYNISDYSKLSDFTPPNIIWRPVGYAGKNTLFVSDGVYHMTISTQIEARHLSSISSVDAQINSWPVAN